MAKIVLTNAQVLVNASDLSNHVSDVEIAIARTEVDVTSMGDVNSEIVLGLGDATITVTFFNDYAAASVDSILFPLNQTNTPFVVDVKPVSGARSTSNPSYVMTCLMPNYNPIAGSIGAAVTTQVAFRNASQTGLQRLTS